MPSILLSLRSLNLPPGDKCNQGLPAGEREKEGGRERGWEEDEMCGVGGVGDLQRWDPGGNDNGPNLPTSQRISP